MADNNALILNASQSRKSTYSSSINASATVHLQLPIVDILISDDIPAGGDINFIIPTYQFHLWKGRRITIAKNQDTSILANTINVVLPVGNIFNTTGINVLSLPGERSTVELVFPSTDEGIVAVVTPVSTAGGGVIVGNIGTGEDILANPGAGAGPFNFKTLVGDSNIIITPSADELAFSFSPPPTTTNPVPLFAVEKASNDDMPAGVNNIVNWRATNAWDYANLFPSIASINLATGVITVTQPGYYHIDTTWDLINSAGTTAGAQIYLGVSGGAGIRRPYMIGTLPIGPSGLSLSGSGDIFLSAGDYVFKMNNSGPGAIRVSRFEYTSISMNLIRAV